MQMPFLSKSTALSEGDPQAMANLDKVAHGQLGIALAGIFLGYPVAIITVVLLLIAGRPLPETLLIAFSLQILAFGVVPIVDLFRARNPDLPPPSDSDAGFTPPETPDIWRFYPSHGEAGASLRIALISPDLGQTRDIAISLAELGREVHHSTDRDAMLASVQTSPEDWGLVIYDFDSAPDLETGVDDLMDFREGCPALPVLLLSGSAQRNDLSSHRRSIGDATLRKPVSPKHLSEGLEAATLNFAAGH
ncbi:hypothetical protein [Sediminimonas sp.]|uniref:hypothetical protein n=1 Tax=Sediminimonas sp. TaxID=2823379 RepID=UPI0025E4ED9F|nr:hypothetical protein [Sediminimonas sp.]